MLKPGPRFNFVLLKAALGLFLLILVSGGCSLLRDTPVVVPKQMQSSTWQKDGRFEVICEQGETLNLGGITVIRDRSTGQEYLVVTGLNGAPAIYPLESQPINPKTP